MRILEVEASSGARSCIEASFGAHSCLKRLVLVAVVGRVDVFGLLFSAFGCC